MYLSQNSVRFCLVAAQCMSKQLWIDNIYTFDLFHLSASFFTYAAHLVFSCESFINSFLFFVGIYKDIAI